MAALHELLRAVLPEGLDDWVIKPDAGLTELVAADELFRAAYGDLLEP